MARICTVNTGIEEGLCWMHLVDEAVVDDGAADLLVELEERLHLVHGDFGSIQFQSKQSQMRRHCEMEAEKPRKQERKGGVGLDRSFYSIGTRRRGVRAGGG